jgi:hypothetical protein
MRQSNLFTVGRLDQKQTIPSASSSNLTHQLKPVEIGDCLRLRQRRLRENLKSPSPIGSSIRYANNTLGIRLSKLRLERKHYENVGRRRRSSKPPLISAVWRSPSFDAHRHNDEWAHGSRSRQTITTNWLNQTQRQPQTRRPRFHQATPDPAARATTREWPDDHRLGLHDPVVEGARSAGVERHGL